MSTKHYDPWHDVELLNDVMNKFESRQSGFARLQFLIRMAVKRFVWTVTIGSTYFIKRVLDVVVSLLALIMLSPLFLITWLAIKVEDPGPSIYIQNRIGKWGKTFAMYKFRSMVMNADALKDQLLKQNESEAGVIFKMKNDPRITRTGKIIRKLSIDELPQLVNVLKGDMSLVGPRPPVQREVDEYSIAHRMRLEVTPGITCLWQIGGRSDIDFEGQVRLDVQYIRERRFLKDVLILLKTVPAVLLGKGAY